MTKGREIQSIDVPTLIRTWDGFLLDSYGVLVHGTGPMPGAREFLAALHQSEKPFWIVTNDCSRLPETIAHRYAGFGLSIRAEQVLTSGLLLISYLQSLPIKKPRVCVLGTSDSVEYVRRAGAEPVPISSDPTADVIAVCDDSGFPSHDTLNQTLSLCFRLFESGTPPALVLPNPDLFYPRGVDQWAFTAGAMALLLEAGLKRRFPERKLTFHPLGKPEPALFLHAQTLAPGKRLVMVGDQIETDIRGARAAGIDAILIGTGVSRFQDLKTREMTIGGPTHYLASLEDR